MALRKNNQADYNNFADTTKDVLGKETDPPKSGTLRSRLYQDMVKESFWKKVL